MYALQTELIDFLKARGFNVNASYVSPAPVRAIEGGNDIACGECLRAGPFSLMQWRWLTSQQWKVTICVRCSTMAICSCRVLKAFPRPAVARIARRCIAAWVLFCRCVFSGPCGEKNIDLYVEVFRNANFMNYQ